MIDLLLVGAVWTGAPDGPAEVGAIGITDGRVVYLGAAAGAPAAADRREVPFVGPGFVDAHVHLQDGGLEALGCDLTAAEGADAILAAVAACAAATPGRRWVVGSGWALTAFPDANPTAEALDRVSAGHPVFLLAADGHSAWLDSEALARVSGVDPPGGRYERGPDGRPTGTLREAAADEVYDILPSPTRAERAGAIRYAVAAAHRVGITGALEAWADAAALRALRAAARRGELPLRLAVALDTDPARGPEQVRDLARLRRRFEGPGLRVSTAKAFVDGVIESRTAAMLAPWADDGAGPVPPDWSGPALRALAEALRDAGFGLHLHAIGDAAVRIGLDAAATGCPTALAHLEAIDPADVPRFAEAGAAAVFQPLWAWPDAYVRDLTWPAVSPETGARLYPIAELAAAGAPLAFGSDWSVSSLAPLDGLEVAVTRSDPDGIEPGTLGDGISVERAMLAYTTGAAAVAGVGGPLRVGAPADLVVLDADPRAVAPDRISEIAVLATYVGGRAVWSAPGR